MKKYDAVIAGYTCVDMIPDFKKTGSPSDLSSLFKPGKLIEIDGMIYVLGGAVPNTGIAMKKFGMKVFLNGLVGDDFIGKMVKERLDEYDLSEGLKTTDQAGTAFSIVLAPPGTDRIFLESPGCSNIFDLEYINFGAVSQSRLFHFGYPPLLKQFYQNDGSQLRDLLARVQSLGVATSLDFSLPDPESESGKLNWPKIMHQLLPFTDIFVPSLEELLKIMQPLVYDELISSSRDHDILEIASVDMIRDLGKQIINLGVKVLLIKAGHKGAYLLTGDINSLNSRGGLTLSTEEWNHQELWCNAYKADPSKIRNSSGAGDTSAAAFLSAILLGKNPELSVKYAALAGRNNLYCTNIYDDLDNWDSMTEEINSVTNELINF
jgi:sugar/nucleoside kinase (ribokinase family)